MKFQPLKLGGAFIYHVPHHFFPYFQHPVLSRAGLGKEPSSHEKIQDLHHLHGVFFQHTAKLLYIGTVLHHRQILQILVFLLPESGKQPLQCPLRLRQKLKILFCPYTDIFRHILQKPQVSACIFIDAVGGEFFRKLFSQGIHQICSAFLLRQMAESHHPHP